jgi:phage terminase large subunit-like protein
MLDPNLIPDSELDDIIKTLEAIAIKSPLDYVPHPSNPKTGFGGMLLFHCSTARVRCVFGGNQSGKTVSGANELLFHATGIYPDWYPKAQRYNRAIKGRIIGEDYTKWGKVLETKLLEWLPKDLIVRIGKTMKGAMESIQIRHTSGQISYIDVMTHEQEDGVFESWTGDFAWFDEPPPQAKYVATVRGLMAQGGRAIFTLTPLKEPWLHDSFVLNKSTDIETWYVDITDNPWLTQKDIDWFASQLTEDERDARLHGKSKHLAGRVYKEFDEAVHIVAKSSVKVGTNWPTYFVCDPHDRKPHYALWARVNPLGVVYIVDEIKFKGTIKQFSKEVRVREALMKIKSDDVIRVGDPNKMVTPSAMNGRTFQQEFCGDENPYKLFFNVLVNDDIALGHLSVAGKLMWDKTKPLSTTNCPKIYWIKETTPECQKEMLTYVWDDWRGSARDSKGLKEVPKDRNKDFPDCIRYLVMFNPGFFEQDEKDPVVDHTRSTGY